MNIITTATLVRMSTITSTIMTMRRMNIITMSIR